MVRILSDADVASVLEIESLLPVVRDAFVKQGRGDVERPDRPHFPVGAGLAGDAPLGTGLVMPAYIHGAAHYATKLVGVHDGNADRGLPTVNAQIALTDAETGRPAAFVAGTRITNARTGCIGGLAAADLAAATPIQLAVIGAGTQARWQARCIAAATDVESIRVYSPSDSKLECAAELESELGIPTTPVESADEAVADATVVVTATTATSPVFSGEALQPGTLVIAVGAYSPEMRELDRETFARADETFGDVPEEVAEIGDVRATDLDADDFVPLSDVFEGSDGRSSDSEIVVVESVGSAVLDAAASEFVFERASEAGTGEEVEL
ncbi:ornithine cyclodeaminase [Haladaptatus sp. W1]|uniref:ornithine cyclodeaminase family protein n=1 Tax=Haladaptatus sp. W1 TaxID=1897478 RepID=UPI0008497A3C|nr:ornithine cyclodeaminase family protein [Haladaptatus sp. W1]ODR81213.1 ornithine cyclodeaminase [Haladaptatus sp. W1]